MPACVVTFATLLSITISFLRQRQQEIRTAINTEAGELRVLSALVDAFPAGAALSVSIGWRGAVWVAAAVMAFALAPLFAIAGRMLRRVEGEPDTRDTDKGALGRALGTARFWMLAVVFSLVSLNHWMLIQYAVPIFVEQGASQPLAVFAASTVGPAQVLDGVRCLEPGRILERSGQDPQRGIVGENG